MKPPSLRRRTLQADQGTGTERSPAPPIIPPISMAGDFPSRVTVIPGSTSSLILAAGVEDDSGQSVLIPFVDLKIVGVGLAEMQPDMEEDAFDTLLSKTLPVENAVFLSFDMVRDLRIGLQQLAGSSGDGMGIEPERLKLARVFAEELRKQAVGLIGTLDELVTGAEVVRLNQSRKREPRAERSASPEAAGRKPSGMPRRRPSKPTSTA